MALTVVSKPSGLQPVGGGQLIYVMTEAAIAGKPNYRVQFQFNGYTATLPIFEYRVDGTLTLRADIAPVLKSLLQLSETPGLRFLNTYVKYQAVWDGGSDAQVNLNADVIYFFTGNNSILNTRSSFSMNVNQKLLYLTSKLYCWNGRTAYIDFLIDGSTPWTNKSQVIIKAQGAGYPDVVALEYDGSVYSMQSCSFKPLNNTSFLMQNGWTGKVTINESNTVNSVKIYPGSADYQNGIGQSWRATAAGPVNRRAFIFYAKKVGNPTYTMTVRMVKFSGGVPSTNPVDIVLSTTFDLSQINSDRYVGFVFDLGAVTALLATDYFIEFVPNSDGVFSINDYYLFPQSNASTYANGSVYNKPAGAFVADANRDFYGYMQEYFGASGLYGAIFTFPMQVLSESLNPIYLKWLNDNGGLSAWLFDYNQVLSIDPKALGRYKYLDLYAKQLPLDAWLMINELNKDGIDYGDNQKSGQYARDFTDETSALPVFIIPKMASADTRSRQFQQDLKARYQLAPNTMT